MTAASARLVRRAHRVHRVDQGMRIANEEIFGPVLSVLKWKDEEEMFRQVNAVDYGLTGSIWTTSLATPIAPQAASNRASSGSTA